MDSIVNLFASSYFPLIEEFRHNPCSLGVSIPLPSFSAAEIEALADATLATFKDAHAVIEIEPDIHIIGDVHGNFFDLVRILASLGDPFNKSFLFLGDFVDRGTFSLDVVLFIFTMRCMNPSQVHFIRGNHEFRDLNHNYGFRAEIMERFESDALWERINQVFDYLPFVAIINKDTICVHGGFGPSTNMDAVRAIKMPLQLCQPEIITDLVWSDPGHGTSQFLRSGRGLGSLFGRVQLLQFLRDGGFVRMVRGHECVNGIKRKWNKLLVTVFSTSNYAEHGNLAGMLHIDGNGVTSDIVFKNAVWLTRAQVRYRQVTHAVPGWQPMAFKLVRPMQRHCSGVTAAGNSLPGVARRDRALGVGIRRRTNSVGSLPNLFSGPHKDMSSLSPLQELPPLTERKPEEEQSGSEDAYCQSLRI